MSWVDLEPLSDAELKKASSLKWRPKPHRRDYTDHWTVVEFPDLSVVGDFLTEFDARLIANLPRLAGEILRLRSERRKAAEEP